MLINQWAFAITFVFNWSKPDHQRSKSLLDQCSQPHCLSNQAHYGQGLSRQAWQIFESWYDGSPLDKTYLMSAVSHLTTRLDGGDEHFSFTSSFPLIALGPSTDKLSGPSFRNISFCSKFVIILALPKIKWKKTSQKHFHQSWW